MQQTIPNRGQITAGVDESAVNGYVAARGGNEAGHYVHGCGFTRAVRPKEADDFTLGDGKAYMVYRNVLAVNFCKVTHFYSWPKEIRKRRRKYPIKSPV